MTSSALRIAYVIVASMFIAAIMINEPLCSMVLVIFPFKGGELWWYHTVYRQLNILDTILVVTSGEMYPTGRKLR